MIPYFDIMTFRIGPATIYVWGLMVALGFLIGALCAKRYLEMRKLDGGQIYNLVTWIIIAAMIGARLGHVIFYEPKFYFANPLEIFYVWRGGLASTGGFIGAAIAIFIFLKKQPVSSRPFFLDALAFGFPWGYAIGRVGCFLTHMHPGRFSNLFFAVRYPDAPRFDGGLIEAVNGVALGVFFLILSRRPSAPGFYFYVGSLWYATVRFFTDFLRATDLPASDVRLLAFTPAQWACLAVIVVLVGSRAMRRRALAGIVAVLIVLASIGLQPALADDRAVLESELKNIEAQIQALSGELSMTQKQSVTLAQTLERLKRERARLNLQIKATATQIEILGSEIGDTTRDITSLEARAAEHERQIGALLQTISTASDTPWFVTLLDEGGLGDAFVEFSSIEQIIARLEVSSRELTAFRSQLAERSAALEEKRGAEQNFLSIKTLQQTEVVKSAKEQRTLLDETHGKEAEYKAQIADHKRRADEIRSRIYELLGIEERVSFGRAVELATWAGGQTGVRSALLLAVLTQESNLGKNVGTCNRPGDPPEKSWRVVMKPERDHAPFLAVTGALGRDPDTTPVSCPMRDKSGKQIGWGGAMGPAQFIPSTWVRHEGEIRAVTGRQPNPFDLRDAFLAAAILLKANGASAQTAEAEWAAAMRYFSGSTNPRFRFYGDNVLALATGYESDLAALK